MTEQLSTFAQLTYSVVLVSTVCKVNRLYMNTYIFYVRYDMTKIGSTTLSKLICLANVIYHQFKQNSIYIVFIY